MPLYRVVHFVPDPFSGGAVPIAALVEADSSIGVARAIHLPAVACLGGPSVAGTLDLVLETLGSVTRLDELPMATGPHAVLGPARELPFGISDPIRWLQENVLPRPTTNKAIRTPRRPRRATEGYRFFETWRVDRFVHRTFRPNESWSSVPASRLGLAPISHWAGSPDLGLLLMEPISPARLRFDDDVREVNQRFSAYRVFLGGEAELLQKTRLLAYLLPGGTRERREQAALALGRAAEIIDTESEDVRLRFVQQIRTIGEAAQGTIPLKFN